MKEQKLDKRLREWELSVSAPDSFRRDVWRRIEEEDATGFGSNWILTLQQILRTIQRPAIAAAIFLFMAAGGLSTGIALGNLKESSYQEQLKAQYVASIDPLDSIRGEGSR